MDTKPGINATWTFDHEANLRLRNNLKNVDLQFHKTYEHLTW